MNIRPIRTEEDLTWALAEVETYFLNEPEKGSADAVRFEVLADLIRAYESLHWALEETVPDAERQLPIRAFMNSNYGSLKSAIKNEKIAKLIKQRKGQMSASSSREPVRTRHLQKHAARLPKAG